MQKTGLVVPSPLPAHRDFAKCYDSEEERLESWRSLELKWKYVSRSWRGWKVCLWWSAVCAASLSPRPPGGAPEQSPVQSRPSLWLCSVPCLCPFLYRACSTEVMCVQLLQCQINSRVQLDYIRFSLTVLCSSASKTRFSLKTKCVEGGSKRRIYIYI